MVMDCPFCGSSQVMVINSRPNSAKTKIWRRRKCMECKNSFTTYEKINLSYLVVIKKSGKKQMYDRAKLYASIYHSCLDKKGIDRGSVSDFSEKTTDLVEKKIFSLKKKQIETVEILKIVLKVLRQKSLDTFLRYLAYRKGEDRKGLVKEIRKFF
jgi:transcriptional repressor NrdR